jgi:hypothetical protein
MTTQFVPHRSRAGLSEISEEYHEVRAEKDAFARFSKELAKLDTSGFEKNFGGYPAPNLSATTADSRTSTGTVRDLYQSTIMDVTHYEDEYGEPFVRNCAIEFSPEIATALQQDQGLVPPLKNQLIQASQKAYRGRTRFLKEIEHERSSLKSIDDQLTKLGSNCDDILIVRSFSEWADEKLLNAQRKAQEYEQECQHLVDERQTVIRDHRSVGDRQSEDTFTKYSYDSLSVTYPALADISDFVQILRDKQSRISAFLPKGATH